MRNEKNLFDEFPPISRTQWETHINKDLNGTDYKTKLQWETGEGVNALPFYRRDDFEKLPAPITSNKNDWQIRQPVAEQNIENVNRIAKNALKNGADALEFIFNIQSSEGALGGNVQGVAIQDQTTFRALLDGINLSKTPLHFESDLASPVILAMLQNECERRGINATVVQGSVLFDPYAFFITNGRLPNDEEIFVDQIKQMATFCDTALPNIKSLGIDAKVYHNAGGTIVQELGYALAVGSEYLAKLGEAGTDISIIADAIHFNFSIGSNYFLEIAKLRAARKLWRKVLDAYDANNEHQAYIHSSSSQWNKTLYDPYVNMLRTTTEGMSAAIAGCDSITLHPFNETFRTPDDFSRRIARNTQIILKEEAYFHKVADLSAGSYYIEILTDKISAAAWRCFQQVEQQGGILKSIQDGYIQTAIEESRQTHDQAIARRGRIFVGTNQFPNTEDAQAGKWERGKPTTSLQKTDEDIDLDPKRLMKSLKKVLQTGSTMGDVLPLLFELTKFDVRVIHPYRGTQAFEALRQATESHASTPKVLTLPLGNKKKRKARSAFAVNFFGCVGYDITDPIGFASITEATTAIQNERPDIVVLCSSDDEYKELVPGLCKELNQMKNKPLLVLAGYPKTHLEQYKKAGIDAFIHAKCNVLETLKKFQQNLRIIKNDE